MSGSLGPMWFEPAPSGYPWSVLAVPVDITKQVLAAKVRRNSDVSEADSLVDQIKEAGNRSLRHGDHYDALWKYNHALVLCRDHKLPAPKVAVISSNCAQACLNLKYYLDALSHSDVAIRTDPQSSILHKALFRRAEATKLLDRELVRTGAPASRFPRKSAIKGAIEDYCHCFRLKDTNTRAMCEAIILAVDHSVPIQMAFLEHDIECGATTQILQELLSREDARHAHLSYLLLKMEFLGCSYRQFDCSSILFRQVCRKSLGKRLLTRLFALGMVIFPEDVVLAVELLPDTKIATLDLIAANCKGPPRESLSLAYVAAEKLKKPQLLDCLIKRGAVPPVTPQEKVAKLKTEGNKFFHGAQYNEALAKYYQALPLCQQHKLEEEEALIRGNCAQVCLLLELFRDAFDHANECIRLDPESSKGYYRRAEALRKLLESPDLKGRAPEGYSFSNVVTDYFQCHRRTESMKAIYQAIVVATNHNCTKSLPSLTEEEIASGLATRILMELVQRGDSEQKHFNTLLSKLVPDKSKSGVDASSLSVTNLLKEKSITSIKLIQRLLKFGMKVTETDVASAVQILHQQHTGVFQELLKECIKTRRSTFSSACQEAIKARKLNFIVCLIKCGGMPDVEDLKDVTGWPRKTVDPVIEHYLMENTQSSKKKEAETEYFDDTLPESALMAARRAYKQGEMLHKAGQPFLAHQQFEEALGCFDAAHRLCTGSLNACPSAKMYYVRAEVLHTALSSQLIAKHVPRDLNHGFVVSDYCESHRLEDNVTALTEAIIIAVDTHKLSPIQNTKRDPLMISKHVKNGFSTKLLLNLLKHQKTKVAHVKVLLEMPIHGEKPHFDGSKVALSMLFQRKLADGKILKPLFKCGMTVQESDMKLAIETLAGDRVTTLDILCTYFNGDLNAVCPIALKLKKIKFVLCLLKRPRGCELPCTSQEVLTLALQKNYLDIAESLLPFCKLAEVDLGKLMHTCKNLVNHPQLIVKMIDGGMNPNGLGKHKPLVEVHQLTSLGKKVDLICLLLEKGCDCTQLCIGSEYPTTPIHIATTIGLEAGGNTRVLDAVVASKSFCLEGMDGKLVDGKGCTPLHLALKSCWKRDHSTKLLKALIETHEILIDPSVYDHHSKKATDLLGKKDQRRSFLTMATNRLHQVAATGKTSKKKERKENGNTDEAVVEVSAVNSTADQSDKVEDASETAPPPKRQDSYEMLSVTAKLDLHLKAVFAKGEDYFLTETKEEKEDNGTALQVEKPVIPIEKVVTDKLPKVHMSPGASVKKSPSPQPLPKEDDDSEMKTVMSQYGLDDFDGLPWEVEVTNNVLKFFKSEKEHPYTLRLRAARTVYNLAEGKRSKELSKELSSQSANLFEAKISKGGRILWQKAVQFSPRRTGEHCNPIYAQVIRIWEIVPDHDQLNQTIKSCVKHIELSNERGKLASLNVPLVTQREVSRKQQSVRNEAVLEIPKIFTQADIGVSGNDVQRYTPAASPKEDEFNVTTFYSFSGAVLKSMLTGSSARRDFPFKEWPKEHEIINLPDTEAILLLGRSGTGKTTCCLYRLWNEFRMYWDCPSVIMLPRKPLVTLKLTAMTDEEKEAENPELKDMNQASGEIEDAKVENIVNQVVINDNPEKQIPVYEQETEAVPDEVCTSDELSQSENDGEDNSETESTMSGVEEVKEIEEHLHQVFVTKNYVLCAQMKKRFYDMVAAHDFLENHVDWESRDIPHSFAEIDDYAYPLFLTARQFYILLDNSIGDEQCFFRPREKDGSLKVKILSTDYDHEDPDTLLDLEDSDSEGEDVADSAEYGIPFTAKPQTQTQKYVEVTSLYFTESIWPVISQKCGTRHLDPMLVWLEIQSFIKGSRAALLKGSALHLEDYLEIGHKMAPNFSTERETIYKLYKRYEEYCQNKRHNVFLFDECDLVHDIHHRLRAVQDLPWSIHTLYIDEVQDFTQAELVVYLHCCRHPNSLFFTGDTAQSIMRGIAFRFQDLRSSFHAIHTVVPQVNVPQEPHTLTINFRSHSGILRLAGSIIDLLQMFFKGSIDHLPSDNGMFSGPTPVILDSCEESDLALLLSSNKRESSRIEFGAHQVVLVQSKEAKDNLPSVLKGAIVLTIFESKGLEFDDVLLYNFFHDSLVDEKGWRVVTGYFEEYPDGVKVNKRLPGSTTDPRSNKFDEKIHKILNSELKYLYTAITRAKCHLWIYDSSQKKRLPMFDLWYKRGLVKVVGDNVEDQHSLMFASISTAQEWKIQGDYFMRRCRWEQAKHCYDRAGPENQFLSVEANARFIVQQAKRLERPHMYLEAAVGFLHRDQLKHGVQCLLFSAQCLRRAKPQKVSFAAELFEKLGKYGEALKCYKKAKDTVNCVRLLEREGQYNEAVRMIRAPKESLAKAIEYSSKGVELSPELMPDNLSYMYAGQCAKLKDKTTLSEMLDHMPAADAYRRARFMKICELYSDAMKVYIRIDEEDEAYRVASGQCLFSEGIEMARKQHDLKREADFVFHQIQAEVFIRNRDKDLPPNFQTDLDTLLKKGDPVVKAHASLLLGMATKDAGLCRAAHGKFLLHNKVAALEAFNELTNLVKDLKPTTAQILKSCAAAREVKDALDRRGDLDQLVKQATSFYGLQKVRDVYLMPPNHNVWVSSKLQSDCKVTNNDEKDLDGMIRLDMKATKEVLASHVGSFVHKWLKKYGTESEILRRLYAFEPHDDIQKKQFLLRFYTQNEVSAESLTRYMSAAIDYCNIGLVQDDHRMCDIAVPILLAIFSPAVSLYLPLRMQHVKRVREALPIHKCLHESWLGRKDLNRMDNLFSAWRACLLSDATADRLGTVLQELEDKVNHDFRNKSGSVHKGSTLWKDGNFQAPPAYQYWEKDEYYYHVFSYWLYSCDQIRDEKKSLWAAKQAIHFFARTVVQRKSLSVSVMNLAYTLILHSMSLFAMLTQLNYQQNRMSAKFLVPIQYKDCVSLFDAMNCRQKGHSSVYSACTYDVQRHIHRGHEGQLQQNCLNLLDTALSILLGSYKMDTRLPAEEQKRFRVLNFAFNNENVLRSGAACHCLILALTLFANMMPYQNQNQVDKFRRLFASFFATHQETRFLQEGMTIFQTSPAEMLGGKLFQYIGHLLSEGCARGITTQALMRVNEQSGKIDFIQLPGDIQPVASLPPEPSIGWEEPQAIAQPLDESLPHSHTVSAQLPPQVLSPTKTEEEYSSLSPQATRKNLPELPNTFNQRVTQQQQQPDLPQYRVTAESHNQIPRLFNQPMTTIQQPPIPAATPLYTAQQNYPPGPFEQATPLSSPMIAPLDMSSELPWPGFPMYEPVQYYPQYHHMQYPNQSLEASHRFSMPSQSDYSPYFTMEASHYQQSAMAQPPPEPIPLPPALEVSHVQPHTSVPSQIDADPYTTRAMHKTMEDSPQRELHFVHTRASEREEASTYHLQQSTMTQPSNLQFEDQSISYPSLHTTEDISSQGAIQLEQKVAVTPEGYVPLSNASRSEEQQIIIGQEDDREGTTQAKVEESKEEELEEDYEGEEEGPGMSAFRKAKWPHLPTVDPVLIDPRIVNDQFCNICGVFLRQAADNEEHDEESGTQEADEVYNNHVRSKEHAQNYTQHKKFKEDYDGYYTGMVEELTALLQKCELTQEPSLARSIDDMKEALEKYERKMENRQTNLQWRMGIRDIEKATDKFQSLLHVGNRQYQRFKSQYHLIDNDQTSLGRKEGDEDSDSEFHAQINETAQEVDDDIRFIPRSEKAKQASRSQKRKKKGKK